MVRSFYSRLGLVLLAVVVAQSAAKARTCAEVQAELARLRQTLANEKAALANCMDNKGSCTPGEIAGYNTAIETAGEEIDADEAELRRACAPPPPPNADRVELQGIEVVQAVQDIANSVILVAGKKTWVRVYFDKNDGTRALSATLTVQRGTKTSTLSPDAAIVVDAADGLRTRRRDWTKSLNFLLPPGLTTSGTSLFTISNVQDNSAEHKPIVCSNCANPTMVSFFNTPPLIVQPVAFSYSFRPFPGVPVTKTTTPTATDIALFKSWVGRAYPVAQVNFAPTRTVAVGFAMTFDTKQTDCTNGNATLAVVRGFDVWLLHKDARTHYIGFFSNQGGFVQGCSSYVPATADPSTTAVSPAGSPTSAIVPVNVTGDTDASFADWYGAHELAHTFGRLHPGFCPKNSADDKSFPYPKGQISNGAATGYTGLDVGDAANGIARAVLWGGPILTKVGFSIPATFDIMTYCNQPQWLSAYTYEGIRRRLLDENPGFTELRIAGERPMLSGSLVHVVANINLTARTGSIVYVNPVERAVPPVTSQPSAELVARAANGNELYRRAVPLKLISDIQPGDDQLAIIDAAIPLVPEMRKIDVVLEGQVLAAFESSQETPRPARNLKVSRASDSQDLQLTWTPGSSDTGNVSYTVLSSTDGKTWELVAVGLTTPELTLPPDVARSRMLRVIVTNGFRNSPPAIVRFRRQSPEPTR